MDIFSQDIEVKKYESMDKNMSDSKVERFGLFVLVVPIGGESENVDFLFKDSIYQSMFLGNLTGLS